MRKMPKWDDPVTLHPLMVRDTEEKVPMNALYVGDSYITVVSREYRVILNTAVVTAVEMALQGEQFRQLYAEFNGRKFHTVFELPGYSIQLGGDRSKISPCLHIFNSYDGTRSFAIALAAMRTICTNYLYVGNPLVVKEIHRWETIEEVSAIRDLIDVNLKQLPQMGSDWTKMSETVLTRETADIMIKAIELPDSYNEAVGRLINIEFERGHTITAWRIVNAYSYVITSPKAAAAGYAVTNRMTGRPLKISMDKKRLYMKAVQECIAAGVGKLSN